MSWKALFLGWVIGVAMTLAALFGSGGYWQYHWYEVGDQESVSDVARAIDEEGWQFAPGEGLAPAAAFRYVRRPRLHWPP